MRRILLTGIGSASAQNMLACLRMAPEPFYIVGCDMDPYHLQWGELDAGYTAPPGGTGEYLAWLNEVIEREGIEFIHGQGDRDAAFLSKHADTLKARTFYPRPGVVQLAQNKYAAACAWHGQGLLEKPPILISKSGWGLPKDPVGYPVWVRATRGAGSRGASRVLSWHQATCWLGYWWAHDETMEFMAEEYLPGREFAFTSVWYRGELICSAARERVEKCTNLQLGDLGTTSTYIVGRSVHDERVNDTATRAILVLDETPNGIYSVDLKEDGAGVVRPTECNAGRFHTTSLFWAEAGCNMPYLFVDLALKGLPRGMDGWRVTPYDAVPAGLLWLRQVDCGHVLVREEDLRAKRLEAACGL